MYIHMGMRATVIQYSINVRMPKKLVLQVYSINERTPKIGFSGFLFIERPPHRTVSPFPIGGWRYLTGADARGALGTVPSGLRVAVYIHPARPLPKRLFGIIPYHSLPVIRPYPTLPLPPPPILPPLYPTLPLWLPAPPLYP